MRHVSQREHEPHAAEQSDLGHQVLLPGGEAYDAVVNELAELGNAYMAAGKPDRAAIRKLVSQAG